MPRPLFLLGLLCLPMVVGCQGCRRDANQKPDATQQPEVPLADFSSRSAIPFPGDLEPLGGGIKPGHWFTASQSLKSNKVDARGELLSEVSYNATRQPNSPLGDRASESMPSLRPVVLPKGQQKVFDYRLLATRPSSSAKTRIYLRNRFVSQDRTAYYEPMPQISGALSDEEYFFVVLTTRPERFTRFQVADWVRPFRDEVQFSEDAANYRLVLPPADSLLPLADTMLDWTSTAVLFWDDLPAEALTPGQQQAIADWVRFGGTLLINGAEATDAISRTGLADLLPLRPTGNVELDPDAAAELLKHWSVESDRSTEKQVSLVRDRTARIAIDGTLADDTRTLNESGDLVLLRNVGRGRVVQTRFDATSDWITNWSSFDSFVNGVMLGRPQRRFLRVDEEFGLQQHYEAMETSFATATMNTRLRIAARDAALPVPSDPPVLIDPPIDPPVVIDANEREVNGSEAHRSEAEKYAAWSNKRPWAEPFTRSDPITGIGGWTDDSDLIAWSRLLLRSEAGIEIPDTSLVVRALGWYLLLLVPINYLVFWLLGRLEFAWLAVPLIALGGAAWVARAARLDIGFARSQTEIALLELQPDYERGHLSRVVAIYNSLSSRYDIGFDSFDSVAAPISQQETGQIGEGPVFENSFELGPRLAGVAVGSNKVRMIHAEQMIEVGGVIQLQDGRLLNGTSHDLIDAYVAVSDRDGALSIAVAGGCPAGAAATLTFRPDSTLAFADDLPRQSRELLGRLLMPTAMPPDSARLVARIDGSLPGMTITPQATQRSSHTFVLAHLRHPADPPPQIDLNLVGDFRRVQTDLGDGDKPDRPAESADTGTQLTP